MVAKGESKKKTKKGESNKQTAKKGESNKQTAKKKQTPKQGKKSTSEGFKNMYEAFTIIPKSQNRFYMFALIVLLIFIVIALVGTKKLI